MNDHQNPIRILHFADAHIDIANYGRHDPDSALPGPGLRPPLARL